MFYLLFPVYLLIDPFIYQTFMGTCYIQGMFPIAEESERWILNTELLPCARFGHVAIQARWRFKSSLSLLSLNKRFAMYLVIWQTWIHIGMFWPLGQQRPKMWLNTGRWTRLSISARNGSGQDSGGAMFQKHWLRGPMFLRETSAVIDSGRGEPWGSGLCFKAPHPKSTLSPQQNHRPFGSVESHFHLSGFPGLNWCFLKAGSL